MSVLADGFGEQGFGEQGFGEHAFEEHRAGLRALAQRLLGSAADADDVVQEAWLRLSRTEPGEVRNVGGWLRTVVSRICLDALRTPRARRETPLEARDPAAPGPGPEESVLLADAVSRALLLVLGTLDAEERVAFVLHDMFAVPFAEIAPLVGRTPATAKKLASRARAKVRGRPAVPPEQLARQRTAVTAFLDAARAADLDGVLAVLAPDVVRRADAAALPPGVPAEVRGARTVAEGTVLLAARSREAELALVDGRVGAVLVSGGRLRFALRFEVTADGLISGYEVIADPERLAGLAVAALD